MQYLPAQSRDFKSHIGMGLQSLSREGIIQYVNGKGHGMTIIDIRGLDHLVLTTADENQCITFYENILGMTCREFAPGRKALFGGAFKINLHTAATAAQPKAAYPRPGSLDLCFYCDRPVVEMAQWLTERGVAIIEGPVERCGSHGRLRSIYIRDPDGNLIELANRLD